MKKLIIAIVCLSAGIGFTTIAKAQGQAPQAAEKPAQDVNAPKFKFAGGDTHDFGTIPEGPAATYAFEFTNTGKEPLIIQNAQASCGCTTPEWPKEPIMPGKKGKITVTFNTQGKNGTFTKDIWIQSNAATANGERYPLHIKGSVTPAAQAPSQAPKQ